MERSTVPILLKFDTIASIMPYYEPTHKAFLLLSNLCRASRRKLDEHYTAFINWMRDYRMLIKVDSNWSKIMLFIPSDLFEIGLYIWNTSDMDIFIKYISNLHNLKGWYFNKHYQQIPHLLNIEYWFWLKTCLNIVLYVKKL